jgi:hypothetical protein
MPAERRRIIPSRDNKVEAQNPGCSQNHNLRHARFPGGNVDAAVIGEYTCMHGTMGKSDNRPRNRKLYPLSGFDYERFVILVEIVVSAVGV